MTSTDPPESQGYEPPKLNRFSLPALVATCVLCFPAGGVLGLWSLIEIRRARGREGGVVFALIAVFVSFVMVPAVIVSALTAGPPKMLDTCVYRQEQAVGVLRVIGYLEERFYDEHARYGAMDEIGFSPAVDLGPYLFSVEKAGQGRYLAVAQGTRHMDGDLLTIDESRRVTRARDLCALLRRR